MAGKLCLASEAAAPLEPNFNCRRVYGSFKKKHQARRENPPEVLIQHWPSNNMDVVLAVNHVPAQAKVQLHHERLVDLK